jgi:hypothetical protein
MNYLDDFLVVFPPSTDVMNEGSGMKVHTHEEGSHLLQTNEVGLGLGL